MNNNIIWVVHLNLVGGFMEILAMIPVIERFRIPRVRHKVITRSLVILCVDLRFMEPTIYYCEKVLRLGKLWRDWMILPIAGGAAAFAHADQLADYFGALETQLKVFLGHFSSIENVFPMGHRHCNFVDKMHRGQGRAPLGRGWSYEDCHTVARAVARRQVIGDCKVGAALRDFRGDARVFYTGIRSGTTETPEFIDLSAQI